MDEFVAKIAQSDQVVFRVAARMTAELLVMDLKLLHGSTALTPPTISFEHSPRQ
jgi:hypothetical protein